jgi:hypothetical protein
MHVCPSGSSSLGRARPCQGRGSGFEARLPLHSNPPFCIQNRCTEMHQNAPKRGATGVNYWGQTFGPETSGPMMAALARLDRPHRAVPDRRVCRRPRRQWHRSGAIRRRKTTPPKKARRIYLSGRHRGLAGGGAGCHCEARDRHRIAAGAARSWGRDQHRLQVQHRARSGASTGSLPRHARSCQDASSGHGARRPNTRGSVWPVGCHPRQRG